MKTLLRLLVSLLLAGRLLAANVQIESLPVTAVLPASDDYTVWSGTTNQTRKFLVKATALVTANRTSLAALSITGVADGIGVLVLGATSAGDGGGGSYFWSATSTATPNGTTIIQPASLPGTGRWLIATANLGPPGASTLGGVFSNAGSAHLFVSAINTNGTVAMTQPGIGDITGLGSMASQNSTGVSVTGGTLDGVTIGGTTRGAGNFTTGTFTGAVSFNGATNTGYSASDGTVTGVFRPIAGPALAIGTTSNHAMSFWINSAAVGQVTSTGLNGIGIGTTTPGPGSFTTGAFSGAVTGAGITALFASPPAIGGTSPQAGTFTNLTDNGLTTGRGVYTGASGLLKSSAAWTFDDSTGTLGATRVRTNDATLGLGLLSPDAVHYLLLASGSSMTANRTITLTGGDADRIVSLTGNTTLNQDVSTAGSPSFAALNNTPIGPGTANTGRFTTIAIDTLANLRATKVNLHVVVNVTDWGADRTGGVDSTAAINNAIAALGNNSILYFPSGKYLTTGFNITGLTNVAIVGDGLSSVIYQTVQANSTLVVDRTSSYVSLKNLVFDGAATSRLNGCGVRFDASNSEIVNVVSAHCSDFGMFIGQHNNAAPTKNVRVVNYLAYQTKGDGFHADNVDGLQLSDSVSWDAGDDAFAFVGYESAATQVLNVAVSNCRAYSSGGIGFRGLALLMVKGAIVSNFRAENMVGSGIEVGDDGNHAGVFNEDVTIRDSEATNCVTSAGPYAQFNVYFSKRCTLQNVSSRDPVAASCMAVADFDDLRVSNCDVLVTRTGFCRGLVYNSGASINGRTVRTTWTNLDVSGFGFNLKDSTNNEAVYLDPDPSVTIAGLLVTGAHGNQVPGSNYIAYGRTAAGGKIANNTCLQTRAVVWLGTGTAATVYNN